MLEQDSKPYYAYQVAKGASSLTEYWDGPTIGHSQNHFMMGHIEEWFYSSLAGINFDYDGSKDFAIMIKPYIAHGIDWVSASHMLPQGLLSVKWHRMSEDRLELNVKVPVSSVIAIAIPTTDGQNVSESGTPIRSLAGFEVVREDEGYVTILVNAGNYSFRSSI